MNVLFVCSRNQWRSPTAEWLFRSDPRVSPRSVGTSPRAKRPVTLGDIRWADLILAMEAKHRSRLKATYRQELSHKPLHVLEIPDKYRYRDPELIDILEVAVDEILEAPTQ
ncbi:MAG: phosphotyrosine protein phosphatase [Actinomycetia bacterium]|nr:phosphotyrosine protein phosphatase [Actinomycetes bacterium]